MLDSFDSHDEAILDLLKRDGRMPFRQMAEHLNLSEATVRNRVRKLEKTDRMRVVARVDLSAAGFQFVALVGLGIKGTSIDEVSERLMAMPEVVSVLAVIGRNDLEIQVIARTIHELDALLYEKIAKIEGIASLECALASNVFKYEQPWGRFA